jgi:hypothetical protein
VGDAVTDSRKNGPQGPFCFARTTPAKNFDRLTYPRKNTRNQENFAAPNPVPAGAFQLVPAG